MVLTLLLALLIAFNRKGGSDGCRDAIELFDKNDIGNCVAVSTISEALQVGVSVDPSQEVPNALYNIYSLLCWNFSSGLLWIPEQKNVFLSSYVDCLIDLQQVVD